MLVPCSPAMRRVVLIAMVSLGCADPAPVADEGGSGGSSTTTTSSTTGTEGEETAADETGPAQLCTALYGRPSPSTGLTAEQCGPSCPCLDGWVAPDYTDDDVAALQAFVLTEPFPALDADPYETPDAFPLDDTSVCGVLVDDGNYSVQTYADDASAQSAGAKVTHDGACGRCSTLQDLAVYMGNGDLTEPVRDCGVLGLSQGDEANLTCLLDLGFTEPCAQIWLYNTAHTREVCLDPCLAQLNAPYHLPDGSLNECLQCDEDLSGPVFKAVAGRTRRNTGLASALCRPCDEVRRVEHRY